MQDLSLRTVLVSQAGGSAGNGASSAPASSADGFTFAYETRATNLLEGATNGVSQIIRTHVQAAARSHVEQPATFAGFWRPRMTLRRRPRTPQ